MSTELKELTPYQCKYKEIYVGAGLMGDSCVLLTPRKKLAELINSEWKYSWYWSEDHDKWVAQVHNNLNNEIEFAKKRMRELHQASEILNLIKLENLTSKDSDK